MKKAKYIISKIPWLWVAGGGVLGYVMIHPLVMIVAYFMFHSGPEDKTTLFELIKLELIRLFSADMLPWSINFALISATAAGFLGRIRQVNAALRESEKRYKELSITDDLTKLYNSRHFFSRLKEEIERTKRYGHPLSLLIMDLDNFKQYNDTYGHMEGDIVLANAGEILQKSLRKTDSAYRYGGEEFTIILPESSGQQAMHFAERIRQAFDKEGSSSKSESFVPVTVSVGVAQYVRGEKVSNFIKRADKNLYAAKHQGKNCIIFSQ